MRQSKPHYCEVEERQADHVSEDVREMDGTATDILEYERSADVYDRRARFRAKLSKGDWWIGVSLYLMILSVAFVVF